MAGVAVPHTVITIDTLHWGKTLEISAETLVSTLKKIVGKQDVITGDAEFDRRFLIKSNDNGFVKTIGRRYTRHSEKKKCFWKWAK